jgi:hypothetical protein
LQQRGSPYSLIIRNIAGYLGAGQESGQMNQSLVLRVADKLLFALVLGA